MDLHERECQLFIAADDGAITDRRIATSQERVTAVFGERPRARILLEASTESAWVARHLESRGHDVLVARNDGERGGKLRVDRFPRQSLVFGPRQIENRINHDTDISQQVSLWDQRGSQVIRGDLLVIPIDKASLCVQPMYLQADGGQIPELKRVVVAYEKQVPMRERR